MTQSEAWQIIIFPQTQLMQQILCHKEADLYESYFIFNRLYILTPCYQWKWNYNMILAWQK